MEPIVVSDVSVIAINRAKQNDSKGIVYRDAKGNSQVIDFETCAVNYRAEHAGASSACVGERKMDELYFVFYTSGTKTKIVFRKLYVGHLLRCAVLSGSREARFRALQRLIGEAGYTTLDLS